MRVPADDLDHFRSLLSERLGLHFETSPGEQISDMLQKRVEQRGGDTAAYLEWLSSGATQEEWRALAGALTVGETYFFRHREQLQAYCQALRERAHDRQRGKQMRILSAGCASGEEPYSLIILASETLPDFPSWDFHVEGVDINSKLLRHANEGRYSDWSLRATSEGLRRRYFRKAGKEYELSRDIRRYAGFKELNLLEKDSTFWRPARFDIIFCRNVTIYFEPEATRRLIAGLTSALLPGGFLFLGATESLRGFSTDYHLLHSHGSFYYRLRDGGEPAVSEPPAVSARATLTGSVSGDPAAINAAGSWLETIGHAAKRIEALHRNAETDTPGQEPRPAVSRPDVSLAIEFLRQEKFKEALEVLAADGDSDPDVVLLKAVIMTNAGQLPEAEELCRQVMLGDEMNPAAHYLLALCREHAGDLESAAEHDRTAIYLDPSFAMCHLHLGLLARRCGDLRTAERELLRALLLLEQENPARILLFGGGFHREALAQLCQKALHSVQGSNR